MLSLRCTVTYTAHRGGGLVFFRPSHTAGCRDAIKLLLVTTRYPFAPPPPGTGSYRCCSGTGRSVAEAGCEEEKWVTEEGSCSDGEGGGVRSPDVVDREYADLKLKEKLGHLGHVRIRQHVNPLSLGFSVPAPVPDWKEVFTDTKLPLMVDIGSGSGRFLIWLAKNTPEPRNYLGLEIRQKLVKRAQFWVQDMGLRNIYFMFANATISFDQLVTTYPGPLAMVSILCPDPHFKRRHHKRRVVQRPLVDSISRNLRPGGQVFLQSDVLEVALDMSEQLDALSDVFEQVGGSPGADDGLCDADGWLLDNPMGVRTEREIHAEFEGARIYRRVYRKREEDVPSVS